VAVGAVVVAAVVPEPAVVSGDVFPAAGVDGEASVLVSVSLPQAATVRVRARSAAEVERGVMDAHPTENGSHFQPATVSTVIATFNDVSVRYGDLVALDRTTTTFALSSSVALVGANGSGKSTVLRLLAGLLEPTVGTIDRAADVDASFIAQQHGHHDWMPLPVDEVLRMGCYRRRGLLGRVTATDRAEIRTVAERLEISDLVSRSFGELSGGQRQRVLVAQALIGSPGLLLLDEPITGLDLPSQETILRIVDEEVARGACVVFSTHHLEEAKRASRVMLLAGCVIADGMADEVLVPEKLALAFGGRLLQVGDAVLVDDHGHGHEHGHDVAASHDAIGHRHLHQPEHAEHVSD
jgi:ABC-type Mn2+/Zn2+ transport system ATPase subunit